MHLEFIHRDVATKKYLRMFQLAGYTKYLAQDRMGTAPVLKFALAALLCKAQNLVAYLHQLVQNDESSLVDSIT